MYVAVQSVEEGAKPPALEETSNPTDGVLCSVADGKPEDEDMGFAPRAWCLLLLLALQSTSSFVLEHFQFLIQQHPSIIFFLTMLVGAGGNAGCQSAVKVIRQLAIASVTSAGEAGEKTRASPVFRQIIAKEITVGAGLAAILSIASLVRCALFHVHLDECLAICLSMIAIVFVSTSVGATLPLALQKLGLDPVHAGSAIQVLMDIGGVVITCVVSSLVLGSSLTAEMASLGGVPSIPEAKTEPGQRFLHGHAAQAVGG